MSVKVPLFVRGLDLSDLAAYDRLDGDLAELDWKSVGPMTLAVVYADAGGAVYAALDAARRIAKTLDGVSVVAVHDEVVSVSDIALRCGMAAERVRLWTTGERRSASRPFPVPRQVVSMGSRSTRLYAWREVVAWVRDIVGIDPDEGIEYLDDMEIAQLDYDIAELSREHGWQSVPGVVHDLTTRLDAVQPAPVVTTSVHEPSVPTRYASLG